MENPEPSELSPAPRRMESTVDSTSPLPCPFCGALPWLGPVNPKMDGNCVGYVVCSNDQCQARPMVSHDILVNDERGTKAYQANAIVRWNTRATPSDPKETESSNATSVSSEKIRPEDWSVLDHLGGDSGRRSPVAQGENAGDKGTLQSPLSSPSAAAVSEEEKWTVSDSRLALFGGDGEIIALSGDHKLEEIAVAHNASLERHAKRAEEKILEERATTI